MLEFLDEATAHLQPLLPRVTFVGGATPTLVEEEGALPIRPTDDVDFIIEIATRIDYYELERELVALGFAHDMFGPICRFRKSALVVDAVPTVPDVLGFSNRWYPFAVRSARQFNLPSGRQISVISGPCFVATKLEALSDRGREDLMASQDFGDIVQVVNGRPQLPQEMRMSELPIRERVVERFSALLENPIFSYSVSCHLMPDEASQARYSLILDRFQAIASLEIDS